MRNHRIAFAACVAGTVLGLLAAPALAGKILHRVSAGTSDIDPTITGIQDANWSLIALMDDEGNVKGQWHDQFSNGTGVHIDITDLYVEGNIAVIGGVIKNSTTAANGYQVGDPVCTFVQDNGQDGDLISFTFSATFDACLGSNPLEFLRLARSGQVKVN